MGLGMLGAGSGIQAWNIGLSLVVHLALAGLLMASKTCNPDPGAFFDPDEVMEVSMVALPRSAGRLPDRATRAPPPAQGPQDPNQMRFEDPEQQVEEEQTPVRDNTDSRRDLLASLRRQQLVDNLADAPLGEQNRSATDPDSTLSMEEAFGSGTGTAMDPEAARYLMELRQNLLPLWNPLPRIIEDNPGIFTVVDVFLDDSGSVRKSGVYQSSGSDSFDQACVRAVVKASRLPLPPDRFRFETPKGVQIRVTFRASDARF